MVPHPRTSKILRIDPSGRFLVWFSTAYKFRRAALEDTLTGAIVELNASSPDNMIIFVPNAKLAVFAACTQGLLGIEITTWDLSSKTAKPKQLASRSFRDELCGLCASEDGEMLFLVTSNRIISRFALPYLQEQDEPLGYRGSHGVDIKFLVSSDGTELASILADPTG
jgi:hypothetical protein